MLERLERQYPVEFERCLHLAMSEGEDKRKNEVKLLFGANWDVDHTSLFLKVNHNSADVRAKAVESVVEALLGGKVRNLSFAVSTIAERLTDSSPAVVSRILRLSDRLAKYLPAGKQFSLMMAALANADAQPGDSKKWNKVRAGLIRLVCGSSFIGDLKDEERVELFSALIPHLIPVDADSVEVSNAVIHSDLATTSPLLKALAKVQLKYENPGADLSHAFQVTFVSSFGL